MNNKFTPKAQKALNRSVKIAEGFGHTYIGTEHLLLALMEDELSCSALILNKHSVNTSKMSAVIKEYSGSGTKSNLTPKHLTPRTKSILESAFDLSLRFGNGTIGTEHILLALLDEKDSVALKLLKKAKADITAIRDETYTLLKLREKQNSALKKDSNIPLLKQYGKNLCDMAREGKFDPVIERDSETERVIRILSRKTKNNPCLIGEAGVGKTAIIEGLAQRIVTGDVPEILREKKIISVDLTSMVAGAKYRGDFEDRIKNIISEVIRNKDIILFIDEIHTIVGAGAAEGAIDASNILKPQLARGEIQLIGATTLSEYHKYIEKDAALERRFQPVIINEPDEATTIKMLKALKERYEKHHNVIIDDESIEDCVRLSAKFISDRFLPDKAIDVLDEACVIAANNSRTGDILRQNIPNVKGDPPFFSSDLIDAYYNEHELESIEYVKSDPLYVKSDDIKTALSEICNIPKQIIKKDMDYEEVASDINKCLPGHPDAVYKIINTIKRHDIGFSSADRPRGIFLFIGESGTGKTAMAVELSRKLFFGNDPLIRFDMSEFSEKHSISKLIGSPPGYMGHEEGGNLTETVRKKPHSLILFDEIEKADKEVLNIILQIADYGYLSDSSGRHVNFKNTVIVMTSNIGCSSIGEFKKTGFISDNRYDKENNALKSLRRQYSPEFLNRFDEIIYFANISEDHLAEIATNKLNDLISIVRSKGYNLKYEDAVPRFLAKKSLEHNTGVRALLKEISELIEKPLIEAFVQNTVNEDKDLLISSKDGKIIVREDSSLTI